MIRSIDASRDWPGYAIVLSFPAGCSILVFMAGGVITAGAARRHVYAGGLLCVAALAVAAVLATALATAPAARAATVLRGINDGALPTLAAAARDQHLHEIRSQLRAAVLRVNCQWPLAEPARGQYSDADGTGYLSWPRTDGRSRARPGSQGDRHHVLRAQVGLGLGILGRSAGRATATGYQKFYPMSRAALDRLPGVRQAPVDGARRRGPGLRGLQRAEPLVAPLSADAPTADLRLRPTCISVPQGLLGPA